MSKTAKLNMVDVCGLKRKWQFVQGTLVSEAIRKIGEDSGISSTGSLRMVLCKEGLEAGVGMAVPLEDGCQYIVRAARWEGYGSRRFAAGHAVNPQDYYFVMPLTVVEPLMQGITDGKYCVLCGVRESGKTTAVRVVENRLRAETDIFPLFFEGLEEAARDWSPSDMWQYFWDYFHTSYPSYFSRPERNGIFPAADFRKLFIQEVLKVPVVIIVDEADSLLLLSETCLDDFFSCIRTMMQDRNKYNLKSFVLVGVETVKYLLEARYNVRSQGRNYIPGTTPSRLSPFPHDHCFPPGGFNLEDVVQLLEQRNAEVSSWSKVLDVTHIAASVMEQTSGHRGLVGTCLAYLVQEKAYDVRSWLKLTSSYKLANYVFGQGTYNSMMQRFRGWVHTNEGRELLVKYLEEGEQYVPDSVDRLRDLLAEGVLAVKDEVDDGFMVDLSSPLLRTVILRRAIFLNQEVVERPPTIDVIDRVWLLLQAIKTLDGESMCRRECLNRGGRSFSEYSYQFLFMSRIKAILRAAYPDLSYDVLPEVREVEVPGVRRSQMRLDTLLMDEPGVSMVKFELVVEAAQENATLHEQHAQLYHRQHSAQVFLVNFTKCPGGVLPKPTSEGVFSFLVQFDEQRKTAWVQRKNVEGRIDKWEVALVNWTGQISFEELL